MFKRIVIYSNLSICHNWRSVECWLKNVRRFIGTVTVYGSEFGTLWIRLKLNTLKMNDEESD